MDDASLSAEERARVISLSSTIAGAVLFLYFVDLLGHGWWNPTLKLMRLMMETDPRYSPTTRYVSLAFVGIWGVGWMLTGMDSIRSRGSRRLAIASVAVLVFGVIVALVLNFIVRGFTMSGVGITK